jgi:azurin
MTRYSIPFALLIALFGVACSAPPATTAAASDPAASPSVASPAVPAAAPVHDGRAIEITADDTMKFSLTEIPAKPGEKLSLTLVNLGTTPKFSMGHNWLLVAPMADMQPFLVAAAEAMTTEYVPVAQKDRVLAATKLLGPKERDTVTFTAPTTPGRYEFLCSFPGHYQVGMRGVLIVG